MNLLVRTARDLGRLWSSDLVVTLGVGGGGVALAYWGRRTYTHRHHSLAVFGFALLAVGVHAWHRRKPLAWVRALGAGARRLGRRCRRGTFEIGLDLRGTPRVRRGTPPIVLGLAAVFGVWAAVAAWGAGGLP